MKLILPGYVDDIIRMLQKKGYQACVVGGCVRDSLLGRCPSDWDICTGAYPDQIIACFKETEFKCIPTGKQHGTVTVVSKRGKAEITTFRTEHDYRDHRRPETVLFSTNLQADLARRDFSINAMAWNPDTGLTDLFGGLNDLQSGILRCVGNPQERFGEDALRILRLFRFIAQLKLEPHPATLKAAMDLRRDIRYLSSERVGTEFTRLLCAPHPVKALTLMHQAGVLQEVISFPECVSPNPDIWCVVEKSTPEEAVRYAAFLHLYLPVNDRISETAHIILTRLRRSKHLTLQVCRILNELHMELQPAPGLLRRQLSQHGEALMRDLLEVRIAYASPADAGRLDKVRLVLNHVLEERPCLTVNELEVNGHDMVKLGLNGPDIGRMLQRLLGLVLDDPTCNDRDGLLRHTRSLIERQVFFD